MSDLRTIFNSIGGRLNKKVLILVAVICYVLFLYKNESIFRLPDNVDFPTFYWSARTAFQYKQSPYDGEIWNKVQSLAGHGMIRIWYPPLSLLAFSPFTFMPYQAARVAMMFLSQISLILFIYFFFFRMTKLYLYPFFTVFAVIYTLVYSPVIVTFLHGQVNLVVLILLCFTWYAIKEKMSPLAVALPLSLAIIMKTIPGIFIFYIIAKKKHKILFWILGLLFAYFVVSLVVLPHGVWPDWLTKVLPTGGYGKIPLDFYSPAAPGNISLNGFMSRIFIKNPSTATLIDWKEGARFLTYAISFFLVVSATIICRILKNRFGDDRYIDLEFSLFLLTMFIIAPFSWYHHLVFVLPAAILGMHVLLNSKRNYVLLSILGISFFILAWKMPIIFFQPTKSLPITLGMSLKLYAAIAIWLYFAMTLRNNLAKNP